MSYRTFQPALHPGPLRGTNGLAWGQGLGATKDTLVERAKDAVEAGLVVDAPSDALAGLGRDARVDRAPDEGDDSWRARIRGAWDAWTWAGNRYGITRAVTLLGYGAPAVVTHRELPIDTDDARWSRLRVIYAGRTVWGPAPWGSWAWGARVVQGIETATPSVVRPQLRSVLRTWINGRDRVHSVIVAFGNPLWGRLVWGRFVWGATTPQLTWGPPAWGSSEARWGAFTWGAFA
jgi:hypothetical protein